MLREGTRGGDRINSEIPADDQKVLIAEWEI